MHRTNPPPTRRILKGSCAAMLAIVIAAEKTPDMINMLYRPQVSAASARLDIGRVNRENANAGCLS